MNMLAAWILSIAVQGMVLVLAAWLIERAFPALRGAWRESLWRVALFGGVFSATLQVACAQLPPAAELWQAQVPGVLESARARQAAPSAASLPAPAGSRTAAALRATATPESARSAATVTVPQRVQPYWIVLGWLAGALLALARTLLQLLRLRRALARACPLAHDATTATLANLARQAGIAPPRLLTLHAIPGPLAAHGARIVLPAWVLGTLDQAQLQAMLAHELAHIARRDPQWKLAVALWRAVFWFVPASVLAQRRLDELAELACDAQAARCLGNPRGLAECLAACAERHARHRDFVLAPAMAARPSSLVFRIERLLEGVRMETSTTGGGARCVMLAALIACAAGVPAIGFEARSAHAAAAQPAPPAAAKRDSHSSISIHSDDDGGRETLTVSMSDDQHKFRANVEGTVDFNDEETDIVSLGAGGSARLEETRGGVAQRVEVSARGNQLERRYFVGDAERPYDDNARALMAEAVKELARSGVNAEARVKRLYARGGADGVLDEIGKIHSDYVRGLYLGLLSGMGKLTPPQLDVALQQAGTMQGDYERRQALTALFEKQTLDAARQTTFLRQLAHFSSDYERAELLIATVARLVDAPAVRQAWLDAALGVQSDYERRRTLEAMLQRDGLDDAQLGSVIETSAAMTSDYEHRELLVAAARRVHDTDAVAPAYVRSARTIHSDYERREALLALINGGKLGAHAADAVLDSAAQIKSGYECKEVLVALARVMPRDDALTAHYRAVATQLPDFERGEAERALGR